MSTDNQCPCQADFESYRRALWSQFSDMLEARAKGFEATFRELCGEVEDLRKQVAEFTPPNTSDGA